jgi:hypothetical protein
VINSQEQEGWTIKEYELLVEHKRYILGICGSSKGCLY